MSKTTFIYFLRDPVNPMKGYVGKTDVPQTRLSLHLKDALNKNPTRKRGWIKGLVTRGLTPTLEIVDEVPFEHWPQLEVAYIEFFLEQGFDLKNGTPGGEDPPLLTGRKQSPEEIAKRAAKITGIKRTPEQRSAQSGPKHPAFGKPSWNRGIKSTPETCAKISASKKGIVISPEARQKAAIKNRGQKRTPEQCATIGAGIRAAKHKRLTNHAETRT